MAYVPFDRADYDKYKNCKFESEQLSEASDVFSRRSEEMLEGHNQFSKMKEKLELVN